MDKDRRKAKRFVIGLFVSCLCIAAVCFAITGYIVFMIRGTDLVNDRIVTISKISVMIGIFFLVLAFGYLLPVLLSHKKQKSGRGFDMSEIFSEINMRKAFDAYIPDGETLLAGIHAVSKETRITGVFGKCIPTEGKLIPSENGGNFVMNKKKYSAYDIYLGITQSFLLIVQCERNDYYYQFTNTPDVGNEDIQEVTSEIYFIDIGTCFPLADIKSCEITKGWMGSVKCFITMKNESYFKLMLPKLGGLGDGMPHHAEYREAIIARLGGRKI